jgi:hypothetical protein
MAKKSTSLHVQTVELADIDPVRTPVDRMISDHSQVSDFDVDAIRAEIRRQLSNRQEIPARRINAAVSQLLRGRVRKVFYASGRKRLLMLATNVP